MDIQAEKLEIIKMVQETENPDILESVKELLKKELKTDFWDTHPENQKENILLEIEDIDDEETEDFDEFIKKYGQ